MLLTRRRHSSSYNRHCKFPFPVLFSNLVHLTLRVFLQGVALSANHCSKIFKRIKVGQRAKVNASRAVSSRREFISAVASWRTSCPSWMAAAPPASRSIPTRGSFESPLIFELGEISATVLRRSFGVSFTPPR